MSKPIKVSTELYDELEAEAMRLGTSLQAELSRRLSSAEEEAARAGDLHEKLERQLRAKEAELAIATESRDSGTSRIAALKSHVGTLQDELREARAISVELGEAVEEWRSRAEDLGEAAAGEQELHRNARRRNQQILLVASVLVAGCVAAYLFRQYRATSMKRAPTADVPQPTEARDWWEI